MLAVFLIDGHAEERVRKSMNVHQGPDTVFAESPGQIFPQLQGSTATNENGRVGNELVFWGFRLESGRPVFLVACLITDNVDCAAREAKICANRVETIARRTVEGRVRRRICENVAIVAPGDLRPGCTENELSRDLAVSLLACQ